MYAYQLNRATVYADSDQFQNGESSFRHAMRNSGGSIEKAKEMADQFVRKQYNKAIKLKQEGNMFEAYYELGIGLHTIQDATSPAHSGFQEWGGSESVLEILSHIRQELTYPGQSSNLQKVTNWFLDSFNRGNDLPSQNLFNNIKSD